MQGNVPTNGYFIEAIGESERFWVHGTEGVFAAIPNTLLSGMAVSLISLVIIVGSLIYIHIKHGTTVFLLLMLALTVTGGGIGHIMLFLPTWAYATRIDKPLSWWRKAISTGTRSTLAALWNPMLILAVLSWITVMELGIFGYFPWQTDPDVLLNITFGFVLSTVVLANSAFICSIAFDIGQPRFRSR